MCTLKQTIPGCNKWVLGGKPIAVFFIFLFASCKESWESVYVVLCLLYTPISFEDTSKKNCITEN